MGKGGCLGSIIAQERRECRAEQNRRCLERVQSAADAATGVLKMHLLNHFTQIIMMCHIANMPF